jgi:hypothetical protein
MAILVAFSVLAAGLLQIPLVPLVPLALVLALVLVGVVAAVVRIWTASMATLRI